MALTVDQEKDLLEKVGKEATDATKKAIATAEAEINKKYEEVVKGTMKQEDFETFKTEKIDPIHEALKVLKEASQEQGNVLKGIVEKGAPNSITFEEFIEKEFAKVIGTGKAVEFSAEDLKKAGVQGIQVKAPVTQTVGNAIAGGSPYVPGIGGGALSIFDVVQNPLFITSRVNLGRTNQPMLAWANEGATEGKPARVIEGGLKPQVSRNWTVELSTAKKIAAYSIFTEEFFQDLPGFATQTRRKLQEDVYRAFDDAIAEGVRLAARPYSLSQLDDEVQAANYWDALLAMMAQVGNKNFTPNTAAMDWLTEVIMQTTKNVNDSYVLPPFQAMVDRLKVYSNGLAFRHALVGDLKQYNVDIYKDIYIKMGLINDQLIHNEETIVVEMRYHDYISTARKDAIVYDSLGSVAATLDGTPTNSSAS